jgi:hypothetical protein
MGASGAHNPTLTAQALAWRTALQSSGLRWLSDGGFDDDTAD